MTDSDNLIGAIRGALDFPAAVARLQKAIQIDTVTGKEANIAPLFRSEFQKLGLESITVRDFLPGRPNLWGVQRGLGGGRNVMIIGHTDTVHVRGWAERWQGDERESHEHPKAPCSHPLSLAMNRGLRTSPWVTGHDAATSSGRLWPDPAVLRCHPQWWLSHARGGARLSPAMRMGPF